MSYTQRPTTVRNYTAGGNVPLGGNAVRAGGGTNTKLVRDYEQRQERLREKARKRAEEKTAAFRRINPDPFPGLGNTLTDAGQGTRQFANPIHQNRLLTQIEENRRAEIERENAEKQRQAELKLTQLKLQEEERKRKKQQQPSSTSMSATSISTQRSSTSMSATSVSTQGSSWKSTPTGMESISKFPGSGNRLGSADADDN